MTFGTALWVSGAVLTALWLGWSAVRAPYSDERSPSHQERAKRRARAEMDAMILAAKRQREATAGKRAESRIVTNPDGLLRELVPPTTDENFVDVLIVELANTGHKIRAREEEARQRRGAA